MPTIHPINTLAVPANVPNPDMSVLMAQMLLQQQQSINDHGQNLQLYLQHFGSGGN